MSSSNNSETYKFTPNILYVMSKGYADYLVAMAREIDRDFQRDADGVDVPLFSNEYQEWLKLDKKVSESSQYNYNKWLEKADAWICESDRDFWTLLKKAWDSNDFETARNLCKKYENQLLEEKAQAEKEGKEEFGESANMIGNWVSAFRKYCKFFEERMQKAETDIRMKSEMIEKSRQTSKKLFLSAPFTLWGMANGLAESTMDSYVSSIRRVNREVFCKSGHDTLSENLPKYVKAKNELLVNELFGMLDFEIAARLDKLDETEMPVDSLKNCRAALKKYAEFIKSILITK